MLGKPYVFVVRVLPPLNVRQLDMQVIHGIVLSYRRPAASLIRGIVRTLPTALAATAPLISVGSRTPRSRFA